MYSCINSVWSWSGQAHCLECLVGLHVSTESMLSSRTMLIASIFGTRIFIYIHVNCMLHLRHVILVVIQLASVLVARHHNCFCMSGRSFGGIVPVRMQVWRLLEQPQLGKSKPSWIPPWIPSRDLQMHMTARRTCTKKLHLVMAAPTTCNETEAPKSLTAHIFGPSICLLKIRILSSKPTIGAHAAVSRSWQGWNIIIDPCF